MYKILTVFSIFLEGVVLATYGFEKKKKKKMFYSVLVKRHLIYHVCGQCSSSMVV